MVIKINNFLSKLPLFLFSFRDSLGFFIGTVPIRIGELASSFFFINVFKTKSKISRNEQYILFALLLNFFIGILGDIVYFEDIDFNFAAKYLLRNILNIFFVWGFISTSIRYTSQDVEKLIRFTVLLQFSTFILMYCFKQYFYMGNMFDLGSYRDSGVYLGSIWIPRFIGTCSEPGYLAPILSFPLYFYLKRFLIQKSTEDILYLSMILLMTIFTFSAAVYIFAGLVITYVLVENFKNKRVFYLIIIAMVTIPMGLCFILSSPVLSDYLVNKVVFKIIAYLTFDTTYMMSSSDRIEQMINCYEFVMRGDFFQVLLGHGTGGYAFFVKSSSYLISDAEEAYNLYLSTLADRGILGLICIIMIFVSVKNMVVSRDLYSQSIYVALIMQFLHWMIVGNFWLYYFWYEIVILIGYYRFRLIDGER